VGFPKKKCVGGKQNDEIDFKSLGDPTVADMGLSAGYAMPKVLKYPDSGGIGVPTTEYNPCFWSFACYNCHFRRNRESLNQF
jgi:hypothetical protein